MTEKAFKVGFAMFVNAFPNADKLTPESRDIYWRMLKDIPDDLWEEGVKNCLRENTFFPTIHDIGVACCGETKEHMEDRCDPLRFKQNYQVRIEAVSWQENLRQQLAAREPKVEIEQKPKKMLPAPKRDEVIAGLKAEIRSLIEENRTLLSKIDDLRQALLAKPKLPEPTVEDRKRLLFEQAQRLGATVDAELVRKTIQEEQ